MVKDDVEDLTICYGDFKAEVSLLEELNEHLSPVVENYYQSLGPKILSSLTDLSKEEIEELSKVNEFFEAVTKRIQETKIKQIDRKRKSEIKEFAIRSRKLSKFLDDFITMFSYIEKTQIFIRNMGLVYLVAEFEDFLKSSLMEFYRFIPDALIPSQKSVPIGEIIKFNNIDDIKKYITENELNPLFYGDIEGINRYLTNKLDVDLSKVPTWNKFKEVFYRRNIIVHNRCIPDDIYVKKTGYRGKKVKLIVSQKYLRDRIKLIDSFASSISDKLIDKVDSHVQLEI